MFSEITHEIAVLVRAHSATILTGTFAILGTIFGAAVNFVTERFKQRGKVSFTLVGDGHVAIRTDNLALNKQKFAVIQYRFQFHVLNSYPIPKSMSLERVELCPKKPWGKRWGEKKLAIPLANSGVSVGPTSAPNGQNLDLHFDPYSFSRLWIIGLATPADGERLGDFHVLRFEILISPKKRHVIRHELTPQQRNTLLEQWEKQKAAS
jgi:hypothetical protein